MKKIILAALIVLSFGAGVANAASQNGYPSNVPGSYTGPTGAGG